MPALVRRLLLALTACLLLVPAVARPRGSRSSRTARRTGSIDQHHSLKRLHPGAEPPRQRRHRVHRLPGDHPPRATRSGRWRYQARQVPKVSTTAKIARNGNGGSSSAGVPSSSGGGGSSSSSGGGSAPAPTTVGSDPLASASTGQRAALTHAIKAGGEPVKVGSEVVSPASLGTGSVGSPTSLPPALIVLLVALGIGAVGIGVAAILPRVRARRAR